MARFSWLYVQLSRFLFSLAERTRLAFPPQDMAAKRYTTASFKYAKTQKFRAFSIKFFTNFVWK